MKRTRKIMILCIMATSATTYNPQNEMFAPNKTKRYFS